MSPGETDQKRDRDSHPINVYIPVSQHQKRFDVLFKLHIQKPFALYLTFIWN